MDVLIVVLTVWYLVLYKYAVHIYIYIFNRPKQRNIILPKSGRWAGCGIPGTVDRLADRLGEGTDANRRPKDTARQASSV